MPADAASVRDWAPFGAVVMTASRAELTEAQGPRPVFAFRTLSKDFLIYGVGEAIIRSFGILTVPIYTRIFPPDEYGILSFVLTLMGLFSAVLVLGGDSAYARYFFEARTDAQRRTVTTTWIGFLALWSLVAVAAVLPFSGLISNASFGSDANAWLIATALIAAPLSLTNRMCAQVLRNQFKAAAFTTLNIISTVATVGFSLGAVLLFDTGVLGILVGALLAELVMLPPRLWAARAMFGSDVSARVLVNLLRYGIPLVPTSLAFWVFLASDRLILGKLSTLAELGLYSVAVSLVGLANIVIGSFSQAWTAHSLRAYEETPDQAPQLYGRVLTYLLVGFGLLGVGLTAFGPELLDLLAGGSYDRAAEAVPPLAIGMVAYASTLVTGAGIGLMKRTKYLAVLSALAALLNVVLNVLLIPPFGMVGSAWATAVSYLFLTLAFLVVAQRLWRVAYEVRRSLLAAVAASLFVVGAPVLYSLSSPFWLLWKLFYCAAFVGVLLVLGVLDQREVSALRRVVAWVRNLRPPT
jgi:O-antigen/teichoic acid export membrane protein